MWLNFLFFFFLTMLLVSIIILVTPKGWRTWALNALAGIPFVGVFFSELFNGLSAIDFSQYLDKAEAAGIGLAVIIGNIFLRAITNTAVGKKE